MDSRKKHSGGRRILCAAATVFAVAALGGCASAGNPDGVKLDPENPTVVTVWHYYNGAQLEAFNALVETYNNTEGKERGILVEGFSQGNVTDLENSVMDAVNQKVGAEETPNIFAAYADTAYEADALGYVTDLTPYLTEEEKGRFVDGYLEEGRFEKDGGIKIFPVAKSVELFMLNRTDWDKFAAATGASTEEFSTMEGLVDVARRYYEWTDSLTERPEDGKAFFGRDSMANYMLIGARQLGTEIFGVDGGKMRLDFDRDVVRKLWDNYYIPYINGYFSSSGRFRSDDIKTGGVIAFIGSSSGGTYFPEEVFVSDTESYPIEMEVYPCPQFEGSGAYAVQQGAGMVVTAKPEQEVYASVQFLKWFAKPENNILFSVSSGYLPVTKEANRMEAIREYLSEPSERMEDILSVAVDTVNANKLYTPKAFPGGTSARAVLENAMQERALADRAAVEERLSSGMTRGEATSEFSTDAYFEGWYRSTLEVLESFAEQ